MTQHPVFRAFLRQIAAALELRAAPEIDIVRGSQSLPSFFAVSDLATATIAMAASMVASYRALANGSIANVTIDRYLASKWFDMTIRPQGWHLPSIWDPLGGNYRGKDGWIRIHTNLPHHRQAALSVLGDPQTREALASTVGEWFADDLEQAILAKNGCAATMRCLDDWQQHPQGIAVAAEPLIAWEEHEALGGPPAAISPDRPLQGIRVLDLTRVLAGPVAGRFLAAYGADVLRIDPPGWDEGSVIPEITLGKRCTGLDLRDTHDRARFEELLAGADILLHGYRRDALAGLGYDGKALRTINPSLLEITLCAYGWHGPWTRRRGFDSLVQMSCGIADWGMKQADADKPVPLPVQALDHATGYLMAASAVRALILRAESGRVTSARHSLARTARLLSTTATTRLLGRLSQETEADIDPSLERTSWGTARRVAFPVRMENLTHHWQYPARRLHEDPPRWRERP